MSSSSSPLLDLNSKLIFNYRNTSCFNENNFEINQDDFFSPTNIYSLTENIFYFIEDDEVKNEEQNTENYEKLNSKNYEEINSERNSENYEEKKEDQNKEKQNKSTEPDSKRFSEEKIIEPFFIFGNEENFKQKEKEPKSNSYSKEDSNIFNLRKKREKQSKENTKVSTPRTKEDDSIRKRIKTRLENFILSSLNKLENSYPDGKNIKFCKMPRKFLENASIPLNEESLNMTLENRYLHNYGGNSKNFEWNKKVIENIKEHPNRKLNKLLGRKVLSLARRYFKSPDYEEDLKIFKFKEGEEKAKLYQILALGNKQKKILGFVDYYLKTPGNKKKQQQKMFHVLKPSD